MRPCFFLHFSLVISEFICSVPATVLLFSRRNTHTHDDYLVIRSRSSFTNHNISAIRFLLNIIFISPLRSPIETHDCNLMALMSI